MSDSREFSLAQDLVYATLCALHHHHPYPFDDAYRPAYALTRQAIDRAIDATLAARANDADSLSEQYLALTALRDLHHGYLTSHLRWVARTALDALDVAGADWVRLFN